MKFRGRLLGGIAMNRSSKAIATSVVMILICIGALSYWSQMRNQQDRAWVTHTHLVVERLQAIRIDITQAETGQRGYILTGQPEYLESYGTGVATLGQDINALQDLTSDSPREQEDTRRLR